MDTIKVTKQENRYTFVSLLGKVQSHQITVHMHELCRSFSWGREIDNRWENVVTHIERRRHKERLALAQYVTYQENIKDVGIGSSFAKRSSSQLSVVQIWQC